MTIPMSIELDVHEGGARGWKYPLLCMAATGRELLRVTPEYEVTIADDLTLDEARELIEMLARQCVKVES